MSGKCVHMPSVPPDAAYHGKISIKAYPTREFGDMIERTRRSAGASLNSSICKLKKAVG